LVDNPREALFQGSGRISFHDNVLIGGEPAAAVFRDHDLPLKLAEVFDNKIYSRHIGIEFGSRRGKISRCTATSSSRKPRSPASASAKGAISYSSRSERLSALHRPSNPAPITGGQIHLARPPR
jgi:hypothetical protein